MCLRLARVRPWRRGSPDPVPNSEVKPAVADSTAAPGCGRVGCRTRAGHKCIKAPFGAFLITDELLDENECSDLELNGV